MTAEHTQRQPPPAPALDPARAFLGPDFQPLKNKDDPLYATGYTPAPASVSGTQSASEKKPNSSFFKTFPGSVRPRFSPVFQTHPFR